MNYHLLRKLLFALEPERAHALALNGLYYAHKLGWSPFKQVLPPQPKKVMEIEFPNQIGLAAGLDKNGDYIDALAELGFGFIEVGTVTPKPQSGNPKPRLFRLPKQHALINAMGFNNKGVDYLVEQVRKSHYKGILGINIGKNKTTPVAQAIDDYLFCMQKVYPYASYITVNISSPNTPGLRELQQPTYLDEFLRALKQQQRDMAHAFNKYVPLVVKIAPDISLEELIVMVDLFGDHQIDGIIATNTTLSRQGIMDATLAAKPGGLSGQPLFPLSHAIVKQLHEILQAHIPIIALGGIIHAQDAMMMLQAGASLVQIYTGFIYQGPELIRECVLAARS